MDAWRSAVLLCSLMVGCGGGLGSETPTPESELPPAGVPAGGGGDRASAPPARPTLGTAHLVKDVFPPSDRPSRTDPGPSSLVDFQGRLFFATHYEDGTHALWASDGTEAGTARVKDFPALADTTTDLVTELTPLGSQLFFVAGDAAHGPELWVTDGTSGGTRQVKELTPGTGGDSAPYKLTVVGGQLLFFRYIPGTDSGHTELWRSDGTEAGTVLVRDMGPDSSLSFSQVLVGNTLFFVFTDAEHGTELWRTDGTAEGTVLVKDIQAGPASAYPAHLQKLGTSVFFLTSTPSYGSELWRTDGTSEGTVRVRELSADSDGPIPNLMEGPGSQLFLTLSTPSDHLLRLSSLTVDDAGAVQERLVATLPNAFSEQPDSDPLIGTSTVAGGRLFFSVNISSSGPAPRDVQLWMTDGTANGTQQVSRPLSLSDEFQSELFTLDDRILYSNIGEGQGLEPWVSDGTAEGTRQLQDLAPGQDFSYPHDFTRVGASVYFTAYTPGHGAELWVLPLRE
ncbi:hypothetical protein D187_010237 [Cystobacter fuscus DSM 2262]|uniref:Lipoprotein n=1 Tax=Cystobacter fuscus (strain ATCC 25194 / DSM 2262 / NBRC 100088 / M29) TaxID=1242864 RepID=S9QY98_CYSF2|nr:ELWxxDGT repeat protein [Cystobacter fuscus]EPX61618.1 hypothetical protein D187_010237 [Cystobacter fuscus DSM 2262]